MSYTIENLHAIEHAIASGEKSVQFRNRRVDFRSIDELERAKEIIKAALSPSTSHKLGYYMVQGGNGL